MLASHEKGPFERATFALQQAREMVIGKEISWRTLETLFRAMSLSGPREPRCYPRARFSRLGRAPKRVPGSIEDSLPPPQSMAEKHPCDPLIPKILLFCWVLRRGRTQGNPSNRTEDVLENRIFAGPFVLARVVSERIVLSCQRFRAFEFRIPLAQPRRPEQRGERRKCLDADLRLSRQKPGARTCRPVEHPGRQFKRPICLRLFQRATEDDKTMPVDGTMNANSAKNQG